MRVSTMTPWRFFTKVFWWSMVAIDMVLGSYDLVSGQYWWGSALLVIEVLLALSLWIERNE